MTASPYRLDTLAASLIERLEAARRTWLDKPDEAEQGFRRIAEETVDKVIAERTELFGTSNEETLRREILETFLPRYTRLAVDHNALEDSGYRAWRRGDPVARIVATGAALLGALVLERILHHPATLMALIGALGVPFIPEFRAWHFRRKYRSMLQEIVDDMASIQVEIERYAGAGMTLPELESTPDAGPKPMIQTEREL